MQRTSPGEAVRRPMLLDRSDIRKKAPFFLLLGLFLFGMIYGVLLIRGGDGVSGQLDFLVSEYTLELQNQGLLRSFVSSFGSVFSFVLTAYLLGFCAIGLPLILVIPFFKGLGLGAFMGYLYVTQGFQGVGYCLLILLPYTLIALLTIAIGCREAMRLSGALFRGALLGNGPPIGPGALKLYHIKFLILCLFMLGSALVHTVCILLFARLFQFS